MFRKDEDLNESALEKSQSFSNILAKWWKIKNHKFSHKLLHMAQNGDKNERFKAVRVLNSLTFLKGVYYFIVYYS
jgi:hypothetical protein